MDTLHAANPYTPPSADLNIPTPNINNFYVVSSRKFLILFIATVGFYSVYWFYKNWQLYRDRTRDDLWPIPRAIFNIFFTHSLFQKIHRAVLKTGKPYDWSPGFTAGVYIVFAIVGSLCDRMAAKDIGSPITDMIGLLMLLPTGWALWEAQMAANHACSDLAGDSNATFSTANYVWIVLGIVFWLLIGAGLYAILSEGY